MEGIYFIFYTYSFFIGICIASFINVVIWRVPQKLSIAKGRSFCPNCKHELKWMDLIPIFSYLFLRGKCRS
ncbi:MAG: prepilin peptidase, partial [Longicatena sp.]